MKNTVTSMEDFSRNMKNFRKRLRMSQNDLAEMLEVSQATISNWENGRKEVSFYDSIRVARILGIEIFDKQNYFECKS